jgi:hypothetical protein
MPFQVLSVSYAYNLSPHAPDAKMRRGPGLLTADLWLLIFGVKERCALRMRNQD